MNKKGFTLVELLAVITVLAIIIGIGMISALSIMKKASDKTMKEMTDNLKDAAITCYIDRRLESDCDTVEKLISNGYFTDDKGYCIEKDITIKFDTSGMDYEASITGECSK